MAAPMIPAPDTAHRKPYTGPGIVPSWSVAAACLVLTVLLAVLHLRVFPPASCLKVPAPDQGYPMAAMQTALTVRAVKDRQDTFVAFGSRFLGQTGMYRAAQHIRATFRAAGLEVYEHTLRTPAPQTTRREFYVVTNTTVLTVPRARGRAGALRVPEVALFPFMPNYVQPMVTPAEGLWGELVRLTEETIKTRPSFEGCIGLLDGSYPVFDWTQYARLGLVALIVAHPDGLSAMPWDLVAAQRNGMVGNTPVNYVRLAASPEIFQWVGQTVGLRVHTRYAPVRDDTIIGVLRAQHPAREALVIYGSYDACSVLPDCAPGVQQALGPAVQLQLLQGLLPYRNSLLRDVIFICSGSSMMGETGLNNLIGVLQKNAAGARKNSLLAAFGLDGIGRGPRRAGEVPRREQDVRAEQTWNEAQRRMVRALRALFDQDAFLADPARTRALLNGLDGPTRDCFAAQFTYVLNTIAFELAEPQLQAKITFERLGTGATHSAAFTAYLTAKRAYDEAAAAAGYTAASLLESKPAFVARRAVRDRCCARFDELRDHHLFMQTQIAQELAIVRLFDPYDQVAVVETRLVPARNAAARAETVSVNVDDQVAASMLPSIMNVFGTAKQRMNVGRSLTFEPVEDAGQLGEIASNVGLAPVRKPARMWVMFGYPTYSLLNFGRRSSYQEYAAPTDMPFMHDLESLRFSLAFVGEAVLSLAHGNGQLRPVNYKEWLDRNFGGRVLAASIGQALVPNYPLRGAVVAGRSPEKQCEYSFPGYFLHPLLMTDVYGRYRLPHDAADFPVRWRMFSKGYDPLAVAYGTDGLITYMKDAGEETQRLFKSMGLGIGGGFENVTIVTFRAAPMTILDLTNPQALKEYTWIKMINRLGLSAMESRGEFLDVGSYTAYLEPDRRCFITFLSGTPENELASVTRAFALGVHDPRHTNPAREIDGNGYLVADTPFVRETARETAPSMASVNGARLALQTRYHMADERMREYHDKTLRQIEESRRPNLPRRNATQLARDAVTYATLNHPVLREAMFEAVLGILWYLALLVPCVFFLEKLIFCHPDIRKQLAAQFVIFLVVFALLRLLHPAFQMVRSSLMILLGFVVMLISGGVAVLFSGKFRENLEELREKRGIVTAAEANTLGVIGSAFMLSLNNMHRRRVRTGLTCATLTLLTFAMICFTSVQSDLVDSETAIGKAPYQGMLIKRDAFLPISDGEVVAFNERYADRYDICLRRMFLGEENWADRQRYNPEFAAVCQRGKTTRRIEFDAALQMNWNEPLQHQIRFLTRTNWFSRAQDRDGDTPCPVMIPDALAESLGISVQRVESGGVTISINDQSFVVQGIFDAASLDGLRDLDGLDLLPFDLERMAVAMQHQSTIIARDDDPRIPASRLVITPVRQVFEGAPRAHRRTISIAVAMPATGYREARQEISAFMEQTAQPLFFGLDGVAYKGKRAREMTMAGLVDLVIPLLIAALTVLNTMRGSVYERRDEIHVYNAVGIAPRYIFAMFFAEAFVYAVVGSVLGYLLSQGTGRVLTMLNLTGGMNMTFASMTTIYASMTIAAAVFLSTYFPAKSAMAIAAPAEEAGWSLPEPDGDTLRFDLPFTFTTRERIAVLAFFERYLLDHGEGGAGRFFSGPPALGVVSADRSNPAAPYVPHCVALTWLKPFDLSVSQQMTISLPDDPETGMFKAVVALRRLSGSRASWMRLNHGFVTQIRQHFLHWRAVRPDQREVMYQEAHARLEAACFAPE